MLKKISCITLLIVTSTIIPVKAETVYDTTKYLELYNKDYATQSISNDDSLSQAKDNLKNIQKERETQEKLAEQGKLREQATSSNLAEPSSNENISTNSLSIINSNIYTPNEFITLITPKIIEIATKYNIWPSLCIANAMQESANGNSYIAKNGNNLFGIKAYGDWTGSTVGSAPANEDNGIGVPYRSYSAIEESITDFCELMQASRYSSIKNADTVYNALHFYETGYAGDSTKDTQLLNYINKYNLTQYDTQNNQNKADEKNSYVEPLTSKILRLFGL